MHPIYSKFNSRVTYVLGASSRLFVGLQNGDVYQISKTRQFIHNFKSTIHKIKYHNKILFVLAKSLYVIMNGQIQEIKKTYCNIYCRENYVVCSNCEELDKYRIDEKIIEVFSCQIAPKCLDIWMNTSFDPVSIHSNGSFVVYRDNRELIYKEFDYFEYFIPGDSYFFVLNKGTLYCIDSVKVKKIRKLFEEPVQSIHIYDNLYCFVNNFLYKFNKKLDEKILIGWGGDRNVAFYSNSLYQSVDNFLLELKTKKHEYL